MPELRVLYVTPFSQQISGPDESLLTLLPAARDLGVVPHVVLPVPGPYVARYEAVGARVHVAPLSVLKRAMGPAETMSYPFRLARGATALGRIVKAERINVVHTNMEVVLDGGLAAWRAGIPHVQHYRGNTKDSPKVVFDILSRVWVGGSGRLFCISEGTAEIFRKRGLDAKMQVLTDPVDTSGFAKAERSDEVRSELGASPEEVLVGTIARIHPRKDVATFLRAGAILARHVPRLRLVVVGAAEVPEEVRYEDEMRRLASQLGIADRLCWAGVRRDIPRVVKALDLFMLCSRNEGFGIAAAEAIAGECPVVLTREGAFPEFAGARTDVLAMPEDAEGFAAAAAGVLSMGREAGRLPEPAIERLMTPRKAARVLVDAYLALMGRGAVGSAEPPERA